jgi:CBS domain containing-hemolysin-like protein
VTIEDLLEEIVGEIRDEYDTLEEEPYEEISENEYICQAGLDLDDLNDLLGIHLPTDENDTLGGYIFTALGKVPEVGDKVTTENVEMEVLNLDGRRIHKVRVRRLEPQPPAEIPPAEIPISLIAPSTPAEDSAK